MIAIDTNVLVRLLVDDSNATEARNLVNIYCDLWVSKIVWVLESIYRLDKEQVILVLEKLVQHPHVHLENAEHINNVLTVFSASNADFADCLILSDAQYGQLMLHTFDRKLARLHGAKRISDEAV
jgi:predicted nucleic-acid-binding protein